MSAFLDIRTLLMVITIMLISRSLIFMVVWRVSRHYPPLTLWTLCSILLASGSLLIGLRGHVPDWLSIVLAQAFLLTGWMLNCGGIILAAEQRPPWRAGMVVIVLAVIATAWYSVLTPDYVSRSIANTLPPILFDLYAAVACLRFKHPKRRATFRFLAAITLLSALSNAIKLEHIVETRVVDVFTGGWQVEQFYLMAIVYSVTASLLYVLLTAQRLEEELDKEIVQRKQIEDSIRQLAYLDALTRLPNRRLLADRMGLAMAGSKRSGNYGCLLFLDLDNFKPLNDAHGHDMGDLLLIEVASRLTGAVRTSDTVARLGGDEFVVLISDLSADETEARNAAEAVAGKILALLALPYLLHKPDVNDADAIVEHRCTASIGATLFRGEEVDPEELLRRADSAMYEAKKAGRNVMRFFDANSATKQSAQAA